jgi:hypothetical protein
MRPGQKVRKTPGTDWGVRVIEPGFPTAGGGWWDDFGAIGCCVGAYQGRGAANYATSLINLANPGVNDLVAILGPPAWNAIQGWFNFALLGTAFDTGLIPAADQSWSLLIQYANETVAWRSPMGVVNAGANTRFLVNSVRPVPGNQVGYGNGGLVVQAPQLLTGNLGVAGNQGYRNGIADGGPIGVWGGASVLPIYVGAQNLVGAINGPTGADVWAASVYSCTLTAPQMLAVATNMAAL